MGFKIYLAKPRGFCAGVERAIKILELALKKFGPPIYVRHAIVHNEKVVSDFEKRGVIFVEKIEDVPEGSVLIFSAHGVSPKIKEKAKKKNLKIIDATCPLVTKVHKEAKFYADRNYTIFLVGHKNHVEVKGTRGVAPDKIFVIESEKDVDKINGNFKKIAVLTQTTLSVDDTREIIEKIKKKFRDAVKPRADDICYATQNRQDAVKKIAPFVDIFLVIGSKQSSNTNRLKEIAEKYGAKAYLINDVSELPLNKIKKSQAIGITSGASTPEELVSSIINELKKFGAEEIIEIEGKEENIVFSLPEELES